MDALIPLVVLVIGMYLLYSRMSENNKTKVNEAVKTVSSTFLDFVKNVKTMVKDNTLLNEFSGKRTKIAAAILLLISINYLYPIINPNLVNILILAAGALGLYGLRVAVENSLNQILTGMKLQQEELLKKLEELEQNNIRNSEQKGQ